MHATDDDDDLSNSSSSNVSNNNQQADRKVSMSKPTIEDDEPSPSHVVDYAFVAASDADGVHGLRLLSRSPHPYHHRNADLLHPADRIASLSPISTNPTNHTRPQALPTSITSIPSSTSALSLASFASGFFGKDSTPASDSGTEADDEHFLKGLPAPRSKPHKGLRGMNEVLSGMSTPLLPIPSTRSSGGGDRTEGGHWRGANGGSDDRRPRRRRRPRQPGGSSGVDTDGGESIAGSSTYSLEEDEDGHGVDGVGGAPAANGDAQGQDHRWRRQHSNGTTAISPHKLFQKLKCDAAALDSRDKDRRQGKDSAERSRRRREIVRRSTELLLLVLQAALLFSNPDVRPLLFHWRFELQAVIAIVGGLLVLYPPRLALWTRRNRQGCANDHDGEAPTPLRQLIGVPASFDPAPLFYPLAIPVLVSFLLATPTLFAAPLLNLILSICVLPRPLIPLSLPPELYNPVQWTLSCVPMMVAEAHPSPFKVRAVRGALPLTSSSPSSSLLTLSPPPPFTGSGGLSPEMATLLYPLHQTLCWLLHDLATTSLLPAELQLLSVALINLLVLAASPQAVILQALLWGGGVSILLLGGKVVRWGIMLARIPRWRFRRDDASGTGTSMWTSPSAVLRRVWAEIKSLRRARLEMMYGSGGDRGSNDSGDNSPEYKYRSGGGSDAKWKRQQHSLKKLNTRSVMAPAAQSINNMDGTQEFPRLIADDVEGDGLSSSRPARASSLSVAMAHANKNKLRRHTTHTHTPSGRRKRATSPTVRAFFSLTHEQAVRRKWMYAGYLYVCIALVIFAGIRPYVGAFALRSRDPFGWALGYLFGDIDWFRLEVVKANLEHWVCLPPRTASSLSLFSSSSFFSSSPPSPDCLYCQAGWIEHIRQAWLGVATTRLFLAAYWVVVIVFGLAVVFTLSPVYEVDTRRKVFHFMMVGMLLPATFVDPAYAALALALVLAVFLLLDLLRASQLPPLSRPIAMFLTPYVDGRDLRGPVVISHIFLLIGCAIPLWLSLAALPRVALSGTDVVDAVNAGDCTSGWEIPTRDVSMVAGIICVGLGDAAASLIGRRWGRRKWLWGGGKSLEGSAAFALFVFLGLMLASLWLRVGGWPVTGEEVPSVVGVHNVGTEETSPIVSWLLSWLPPLPPTVRRVLSWIGYRAAQSVAPRAAVCASVASLTEAVLTGGNDNVVVPVILWTCVKSFGL